MLRNAQRRLLKSAFSVFVLTAGLIPSSAFAQKAAGNTSSKVAYTQSVSVQSNEVILPDGRLVYKMADQNAEYPGGITEFMIANLKYPDAARKKGVEGNSVLQFIISSDGSISDVEVVRSAGNKMLDDESLRVVKQMEHWKPALKDGNPVAVYYILPVVYKLD